MEHSLFHNANIAPNSSKTELKKVDMKELAKEKQRKI